VAPYKIAARIVAARIVIIFIYPSHNLATGITKKLAFEHWLFSPRCRNSPPKWESSRSAHTYAESIARAASIGPQAV
jgi:hypothetical protein